MPLLPGPHILLKILVTPLKSSADPYCVEGDEGGSGGGGGVGSVEVAVDSVVVAVGVGGGGSGVGSVEVATGKVLVAGWAGIAGIAGSAGIAGRPSPGKG